MSAKEININLAASIDVPTTVFPNKNEKLIIWMPSEFGLNVKQLTPIAIGLQNVGFEVWFVDLKAAYFAPKGRAAINRYKTQDLEKLLHFAKKKNKTKVYLVAVNSAAINAIKLGRYWQQRNTQQTLLRGYVLLHPILYASRPELGKDTDYIEEAYTTNLTTHIIQPEFSSLILRSTNLIKTLSKGGSRVFFQFLKNTKDGFYARPKSHLSQTDIQSKRKLAGWINAAIKNIESLPLPRHASIQKVVVKKIKNVTAGLIKISNKLLTPKLSASGLDDQVFKLEQNRGKVTLISFWASWCPPCIRELPSLNRLQNKYEKMGLKVVTINIGESKSQIIKFLKRHNISAKVLLDRSTKISKEWKVTIVPTNFLIGRKGKIRYGSVGAINWDDAATQKIIKSLLIKK